jgi:hypothetical protein
VLQISCFNDMCGDYHDTLRVQVCCMCICICASSSVCMSRYVMCARVHASSSVCVSKYKMCACVYAFQSVLCVQEHCVCVRVFQSLCVQLRYVCMCVCIYKCLCVQVRYVCVHVCVHLPVFACPPPPALFLFSFALNVPCNSTASLVLTLHLTPFALTPHCTLHSTCSHRPLHIHRVGQNCIYVYMHCI